MRAPPRWWELDPTVRALVEEYRGNDCMQVVHIAGCLLLCVSAHGDFVATGTSGGRVIVMRTNPAPVDAVRGLVCDVCPDLPAVAVNLVCAYLPRGILVPCREVRLERSQVYGVALTGDDNVKVVSVGWEQPTVLMAPVDAELPHAHAMSVPPGPVELRAHTSYVCIVLVLVDERIVTGGRGGSNGGEVCVWRSSGQLVRKWNNSRANPVVALSEIGNCVLAIGGYGEEVTLSDLATVFTKSNPPCVSTFRTTESLAGVHSLTTVAHDVTRLIVGGRAGTVSGWNVSDPRAPHRVFVWSGVGCPAYCVSSGMWGGRSVTCAAFTDTRDGECSVRVGDFSVGAVTELAWAHSSAAHGVAVLGSGVIVSAHSSGHLVVWGSASLLPFL